MLIIDKISPELRVLAKGWIPHFTEVFRLQKLYRESGSQNTELERELDTAINNLEEDLHSGIEDSAVPILDSLRQGDVALLADPERYIDFSLFMAMQYMRTPSIMDKVVRAANGFPQFDFNIDAAWGLMRTIYATNMGSVFYRLRNSTRLTILNAPCPLHEAIHRLRPRHVSGLTRYANIQYHRRPWPLSGVSTNRGRLGPWPLNCGIKAARPCRKNHQPPRQQGHPSLRSRRTCRTRPPISQAAWESLARPHSGASPYPSFP